jgi:hypothetical protein
MYIKSVNCVCVCVFFLWYLTYWILDFCPRYFVFYSCFLCLVPFSTLKDFRIQPYRIKNSFKAKDGRKDRSPELSGRIKSGLKVPFIPGRPRPSPLLKSDQGNKIEKKNGITKSWGYRLTSLSSPPFRRVIHTYLYNPPTWLLTRKEIRFRLFFF